MCTFLKLSYKISKFVQKTTKKAFSAPLHCRKLVQIRYHKCAGTKMHKCLVGTLCCNYLKNGRKNLGIANN
jgi:hypothetical protein